MRCVAGPSADVTASQVTLFGFTPSMSAATTARPASTTADYVSTSACRASTHYRHGIIDITHYSNLLPLTGRLRRDQWVKPKRVRRAPRATRSTCDALHVRRAPRALAKTRTLGIGKGWVGSPCVLPCPLPSLSLPNAQTRTLGKSIIWAQDFDARQHHLRRVEDATMERFGCGDQLHGIHPVFRRELQKVDDSLQDQGRRGWLLQCV